MDRSFLESQRMIDIIILDLLKFFLLHSVFNYEIDNKNCQKSTNPQYFYCYQYAMHMLD